MAVIWGGAGCEWVWSDCEVWGWVGCDLVCGWLGFAAWGAVQGWGNWDWESGWL